MTRGFDARLHGTGHPDAGVAVRAEFVGGRLQVAGRAGAIDAAQIAVDAGGFNHDDVILTWDEAAGRCALVVTAPDAKAALLAQAPSALAPRLRRWHRGVAFSRNFWRTAIAGTLLVSVAVVLGLWQYDAVVAWTARQVSPEREERLGRSILTGVRNEGRLVESGAALAAIRDVGARLARDSTRRYEFYLKDDPAVNAFAIPGGFVVVHAGLVHAAGSADQLAGVLAHEIQHIEQRHTLQALIYQLGWAALLTVVAGDPTAITTLMLLQVGNLSFSRELEAQADAAGVETLRRAGVPPAAMAEFFRTLSESAGPESLRWLSTHPATRERIDAVEAAAKAQPCSACQPLPLDWVAVRESLYADGLIRRPAPKD